jgi:trehalose 6-phosphate synthase
MNRIVVVSNRVQLPTEGAAKPGGLAVALDGLMTHRGGLWFGWSGDIRPEIQPAATTKTLTLPGGGAMCFATIDLTQDEHDRYYNAFSNATLWPLLHSMPEHMSFDRRNAQVYRETNARLTDALVPLLKPTDLIWVHDYHLMAMPALLRARGVTAPIGFFLHVPFPSMDLLASVPESGKLVRDLLSSDLVGFQTQNDLENFANAAVGLAGATRLSAGGLQCAGRRIRLGVFPAEIDAHEFAAVARTSWHSVDTDRLRRSLNGQRLVLGIDRLDPTKGLIQRLAGYRRFLETRPDWRRRATFLQIAAESRKDVSAYQDLRAALDSDSGAINSEWGEPDWTPMRIIARAGARATIAGYMREARVGLVTPLRDGMNLVAKEYIAAQDPQNPGVLILSKFAGAARQLDSAILVNPHDPDELADSLDRALSMGLLERQERWRAGWKAIEQVTPQHWGRSFLSALMRASYNAPKTMVDVQAVVPVLGAGMPIVAPESVRPAARLN